MEIGTGDAALANATDQGRSAAIQQAFKAAVDEVGEVTPEEAQAEDAAIQQGQPLPNPAKAAAKKTEAKTEKTETEAAEPEAEGNGGNTTIARERVRLRKKFQEMETELRGSLSKREQAAQAAANKYAPLHRAAEAIDSGDFDGIAQALAEYSGNDAIKDWNGLVNEALRATQSPVYKEVRKLRKERDDERRAQQSAQAQARQAQEANTRAAQERQWVSNLETEISGEEDPAFADLLDADPGFAGFVYQTQKTHHEAEGEILPTRAAAEKTFRALYGEVQKWQAYIEKHADSPLVKKIIGNQAAAKKPVNGTGNRNAVNGSGNRTPARPGNGQKPPPNVSQNRTVEAAAQGQLSSSELKRRYALQMEEAAKTDPLWGRV